MAGSETFTDRTVLSARQQFGYQRSVLGGGNGGDREGEGHGLPAGLLRRLCQGLFLAAVLSCQ
jgi:hypothetical protein